MCFKHFSPIVIGTAVLFEPIGAQIVGCVIGIDKLPGIITFIGTFVTTIGLYLITKGSQLKSLITNDI